MSGCAFIFSRLADISFDDIFPKENICPVFSFMEISVYWCFLRHQICYPLDVLLNVR